MTGDSEADEKRYGILDEGLSMGSTPQLLTFE